MLNHQHALCAWWDNPGTILTENISTVALLPLERMLDVVRPLALSIELCLARRIFVFGSLENLYVLFLRTERGLAWRVTL